VGDAISASRAASRFSLVGRSKMPPKFVDAAAQLDGLAFQVS
jgi:hypothetical protein